jgi:hypothetical protein
MKNNSKLNIKDGLDLVKRIHFIVSLALYILGKIQFFTGIFMYNLINPNGKNENYYILPLILQILILISLKLVPELIFLKTK